MELATIPNHAQLFRPLTDCIPGRLAEFALWSAKRVELFNSALDLDQYRSRPRSAQLGARLRLELLFFGLSLDRVECLHELYNLAYSLGRGVLGHDKLPADKVQKAAIEQTDPRALIGEVVDSRYRVLKFIGQH